MDAIYADDVTTRQNFTGTAQDKAQNIAVLLRASQTGTLQYALTEAVTTGDRVFLRHVLTIKIEGDTVGSAVLNIPAAMFITTHDGQITQIFEYVDSAHFMVPGLGDAIVN